MQLVMEGGTNMAVLNTQHAVCEYLQRTLWPQGAIVVSLSVVQQIMHLLVSSPSSLPAS